VRPLASTDLLRSHFSLLADLTSSPPIAPSLYASIFKHLRASPGTYYNTVIVDKTDDQLVAAATLFVERKHIHAGGSAGHIEEVVVSAKTQGKGLGLKLVKGLRDMGEQLGCYKTILDCGEGKVAFYEKCGCVLIVLAKLNP
jgi:GNAT superfamily N-acetyltransferase